MRNLRLNQILLGAALFVASLALTGFPPAGAQTDREQPPHTRPPVSQAEQEAEKKVSLSAGKIIEILRSEPGLLLAVKKMLVRKAYEQGRILESADLSDEALFRLLREDDNIRVLATREIEDRFFSTAMECSIALWSVMANSCLPGILLSSSCCPEYATLASPSV
ncbi:MAG TPA: hypothetical protein VGV15_04940, partial [Terriglobales bacterium]|nr:hypothetical protein [Terriglobales bacterium]